jgi:hypothetical protein
MVRDRVSPPPTTNNVPHKSCSVCGDCILWRRWLASSWENVTYCSASCRRASVDRARLQGEQRASTSSEAYRHGTVESEVSAA